MTVPNNLETLLASCGSTPALVDLLCRVLPADARPPSEAGGVAARIERLARKNAAFAESLADAISLYLQREASNLEKVGDEFEPLMDLLASIRLPRTGRVLRDWVDRHRWPSRPVQAQEARFAKAIWALMTVEPTDSRHFLEWWMERAAHHADDWLGRHFDPDAVKKP